MKIAHITYTYKPIKGGLEVYLRNLYELFKKSGHKQKIYQIDTGTMSSELRLIKPIKFLPGHLSYFVRLFVLRKELQKFDLLIIHFAEFYYPLRWHPNTLVLSHGATWTAEKGIKKWLRKLANQYAIKHSQRYVFNDSFVPRELGLLCKPQEKMFSQILPNKWFIPNCVDCDRFHRTHGIEELIKLNPIIVPRNITYQRGIDLAVGAFYLFSKKFPKTNLIIIGDVISKNIKYQNYLKKIKYLIYERKLNKKVHFWGNVDNEKMPTAYSSALMTLIPTRYSEGTSLSALESMASGVATISTNIEGLLDLPVIHCHVDEKDLAQKMLEIYPKRKKIALQQQKKVRDIYNINNWQETWLKAIQ